VRIICFWPYLAAQSKANDHRGGALQQLVQVRLGVAAGQGSQPQKKWLSVDHIDYNRL
jgi:hypothetical protein